MNIYEIFPVDILVGAAYDVVTWMSGLLEPLAGAESAAIAIVLLTIVVRILLIPVGWSQAKAGAARERLAPQLAELQRRYRKSPELLQRKTMELYAREKASPFAGCLPVLAQTPVLMAVYGLFVLPSVGGAHNELLAHAVASVPLDATLVAQIVASDVTGASAAVFAAIIVPVALVAQGSRRLLTSSGAGDAGGSGLARALSFLPFMTAVVTVFVPFAAGIYLLTTTAWTFAERLIMRRVLRAA
ncbi:YidC/Oxa1 family membrane protein insertase [Microbacterium karelineae]|uniref:YidC/Oxa1 family membrane protein insertase n=1 Tax=Microbacterium karelineae TaxID=2654283 RepID=UPI0012E9BC17|nr:YidC/Oxa1 family membrane protein insertase [Microbacterium karelineae]